MKGFTMSVIRIPVDARQHVVFSDDGRVFYDLDALIADYEPRVIDREKAAVILEDNEIGYLAAGQRQIIDAIRESREILALDAAMEV
jgi:hypothetical protein